MLCLIHGSVVHHCHHGNASVPPAFVMTNRHEIEICLGAAIEYRV